MNLRFFIDRPVFSGVISVVIVLMGIIAMKALPVEQYPDIAPPTVNVFCTYPGANAESVESTSDGETPDCSHFAASISTQYCG